MNSLKNFNINHDDAYSSWKGTVSKKLEEIPTDVDLSDIHILLVDDNLLNQRIARFDLDNWKIVTDTSNDAKDAIEKLKLKNYTLILMDISMPEMDGLEATKYIRANFGEDKKNIPIIAMTASSGAGEEERCIAAGMNDYIAKPFNSLNLYSKIIKWGKGEHITVIESPKKTNRITQTNKATDLSLLYEHASGDIAYIKEMIVIYCTNMPIYLEDYNIFFKQRNWGELSQNAHKMRSPTTLFGAVELNQILIEIEIRSKEAIDLDLMKNLSLKMNTLFALTLKELKVELKKMDGTQ